MKIESNKDVEFAKLHKVVDEEYYRFKQRSEFDPQVNAVSSSRT
jgi:hypothetical protein